MAASVKVAKQSRSWKLKDSNDSEDLENLFESGNISYTKPVGCSKYWTLYLGLFVVFGLFLFGVIVGFYLRADPKVFNTCSRTQSRKDGLDREKLQAIHNNIMYFMSGDRISKYNRDLSELSKPVTDKDFDIDTAKYIQDKFHDFGFDKVDVEEHQVVITSLDPDKPNTLELLTLAGSSSRNSSRDSDVGRLVKKWKFPRNGHKQTFVAASPAKKVKGPIQYVNEGSRLDFLQAQKNNRTVQGSVVLLQLGGIPIPEKVRNAEQFGAVGVLLFCNHSDNCDTEGPFVSAADFLAQEEEQYPRIPVQTVSLEVAQSILREINSTSLQNVSSVGKLKNPTISTSDSSQLLASLEVNNIRQTRTVYNVIGTIFGADETDRDIIVGAGSRISHQSTESIGYTNLGILLELANSLTFIKRSQGWRPRRTIKLAFWGGKAFSHAGLVNYIKGHRHVIEEQAVSFIDLDYSTAGNQYLNVEAGSSLVSMITKAALMVPDPGNPDISLADNWPKLSHDWYLTNQHPVHNYRQASWYPVLKEVGVPSIVIKGLQYGGVNFSQPMSGETTHHLRYHLASARVVSLVLLQLVDNEKLPFNTSFSVQCMVKAVNDSVNRLKQFIQFPIDKIESLNGAIDRLSLLHLSVSNKSKPCMTAIKYRKYNDIVMKLDRVFVEKLPSKMYSDYLLRSDRETGTLSVLLDAVNTYLLTGNRDTVYKSLSILTNSLEQLHTEIQSILLIR